MLTNAYIMPCSSCLLHKCLDIFRRSKMKCSVDPFTIHPHSKCNCGPQYLGWSIFFLERLSHWHWHLVYRSVASLLAQGT